MASLIRSVSLTDVRKQADDHSEYESYSPQKESQRIAGFYKTTSNWTWLNNAKSFHEKELTGGTREESKVHEYKQQKTVNPGHLDHLERLLPRYCKHLSHPSYQEAARAMSLLLNSPPPVPDDDEATKTSEKIAVSPIRQAGQTLIQKLKERDKRSRVTSEMNRLLSSPFRRKPSVAERRNSNASHTGVQQNKHRWGSISSGGNLHSSSARSRDQAKSNIQSGEKKISREDEALWQDFVGPLLILAGAEAIYSDLEHVHSNPTTIHWNGLYQRVIEQLMAMLPPEERNSSLVSAIQQSPLAVNCENPSQTPPSSPHPGQSPIQCSPSKPSSPHFPEGYVAPLTPPSKTLRSPMPSMSPTVVSQKQVCSPNSLGDSSKYKHLRSLIRWLDFKLQWLPFHERVYLTWSSNNLIRLRSFADTIPPSLLTKDGNGCSWPLIEVLLQEVQATTALLEMAFSLERGRFLDTIVNAKTVKKYLLALDRTETALVLWMKTTFQDYLSIMPLVFDRVHTFASPLYGFDNQLLLDSTSNERVFLNDRKAVVDIDNLVVDFLRRHEKAGGSPMAVGIVLDTDGLEDDKIENPVSSGSTAKQQSIKPTQNNNLHSANGTHHIELGFAIHQTPKREALHFSDTTSQPPTPGSSRSNAAATPSENSSAVGSHRQWPAIYLRSTIRLSPQGRGNTTSSTSLGLIGGLRRNVGSKVNASESSSPSLQGSGVTTTSSRVSWSSEGMSPISSKYRKSSSVRNLLSHGNVFEYEADTGGRQSWPHSEWTQLREILEGIENHPKSSDASTERISSPPSKQSPNNKTDSATISINGVMVEEPMAISFHPDGLDPSSSSDSATAYESASVSLWDPLPSMSLNSSTATPTTFHAVHLSDYMWMIVMVKGEEESRWPHRRKARGIPDEEIRTFLNEMAGKLRVSNRFLGLKTCQTARVKVKDLLAPRVRGRDLGLRQAQWQTENPEDDEQLQDEILQLMKEAFSVNAPILNRAESILTTMSGFRSAGGSRSPRDRHRRAMLAVQNRQGPFAESSDYREGAAMLFLGPELFRQFLETTNE